MTELPIEGDRLLTIWWAQTWRVWALSVPILILLAFVDKRIPPEMHALSNILALIALLIWHFFALGMALKAKYKQFRIVLFPLEPPA